MYIKLNSQNVRHLVNRWCRLFEEYNLSDTELHRLMHIVEHAIARNFELGFSVNYIQLLKHEFSILLDKR